MAVVMTGRLNIWRKNSGVGGSSVSIYIHCRLIDALCALSGPTPDFLNRPIF